MLLLFAITADPTFIDNFSFLFNSKIDIMATLPPGSTDARHVRNAGYPAFGFSPMPSTELLLHSVNERLAVSTFLNGIDIYEKVIDNLANIPGSKTSDVASAYLYVTAV